MHVLCNYVATHAPRSWPPRAMAMCHTLHAIYGQPCLNNFNTSYEIKVWKCENVHKYMFVIIKWWTDLLIQLLSKTNKTSKRVAWENIQLITCSLETWRLGSREWQLTRTSLSLHCTQEHKHVTTHTRTHAHTCAWCTHTHRHTVCRCTHMHTHTRTHTHTHTQTCPWLCHTCICTHTHTSNLVTTYSTHSWNTSQLEGCLVLPSRGQRDQI